MNTSIENRLIWLNGELVHLPDARINVLSPTSQFGANVFEGIRCYWNEERQQLYAFRLDDHYRRLEESIKLFRIRPKYITDDFRQALLDVVRANDYREDIAVRQTVFLDGFGTWSSREPVGMFVAPVPKRRIEYSDDTGLTCGISSWQRISDRNLSPRAKVGANYINSRMAQLEAIEHGYQTAIFLNEQGKVAEGPGSCLFMVRNGKLITPPLTASILDSITRKTLIELAKTEMQLEVIERDIDRTELYLADEVFLCGSAVEVSSIRSVDGYMIGSGMIGNITGKLHDIYIQTVTGELSAYMDWLYPVYQNS
ncbi:MAG: branched-chain amino acid transaminase [Clostridium sp.]|nr:branched-chain amino acid transaminase [Clostridium sp.]